MIEAVDLRVFRGGTGRSTICRAPSRRASRSGRCRYPRFTRPTGAAIRKALANENRLITPGEENLEDLADEFVRLETSNGVTLDGKISKPAPTSGAA